MPEPGEPGRASDKLENSESDSERFNGPITGMMIIVVPSAGVSSGSLRLAGGPGERRPGRSESLAGFKLLRCRHHDRANLKSQPPDSDLEHRGSGPQATFKL